MANLALFKIYEQQLASARRKEAGQTIALFIQSFVDMEEKRQWSEAFLKSWKNSHKIRHELYQHIIFPALLQSYQKSEPWGIYWLAKTTRNLYQAKSLWQQIDEKTEYQLLEQLLSITPDDEGVKNQLLAKQIEWFRYSVHEWPSGILYGHDGATLQQCTEIKQLLAQARALDATCAFGSFLADFEAKLDEYMARLAANESKLTNRPTAQH